MLSREEEKRIVESRGRVVDLVRSAHGLEIDVNDLERKAVRLSLPTLVGVVEDEAVHANVRAMVAYGIGEVREGREYWGRLCAKLLETEDGGLRQALCETLSRLAKAGDYERVEALATEQRLGESRVLLLEVLAKLDWEGARRVLERLADDPDCHFEARRLLKKHAKKKVAKKKVAKKKVAKKKAAKKKAAKKKAAGELDGETFLEFDAEDIPEFLLFSNREIPGIASLREGAKSWVDSEEKEILLEEVLESGEEIYLHLELEDFSTARLGVLSSKRVVNILEQEFMRFEEAKGE